MVPMVHCLVSLSNAKILHVLGSSVSLKLQMAAQCVLEMVLADVEAILANSVTFIASYFLKLKLPWHSPRRIQFFLVLLDAGQVTILPIRRKNKESLPWKVIIVCISFGLNMRIEDT